jgi:hypothetical protein
MQYRITNVNVSGHYVYMISLSKCVYQINLFIDKVIVLRLLLTILTLAIFLRVMIIEDIDKLMIKRMRDNFKI